jgi:hypothetical protein
MPWNLQEHLRELEEFLGEFSKLSNCSNRR